jgi:DNA (cytosine-5)-methyltransferase 1
MKKIERRPVGIDLFAGCGGLSLGFEQAGFEVAAAVEIDPIHSAVHKYNFPDCATICRSVIGLTGGAIRQAARLGDRPVDVVFGGAPCQGFSTIGKRAFDDPRNRLVYEFVRLVVELEARYFVFENVRGLTLGKHRRFLEEIIEAFKENGYDVVEGYRVLNAADYGVPQDRRRLFLLGAKRGLPLPTYPDGRPAVTVADAISDIPDADEFPSLSGSDAVSARFGRGTAYSRALRGLLHDPEDYSHPRAFNRSLLTSSARTEHTELSKVRFTETDHGRVEPISRFHKLDPHGVCNTLRAGTDSARGAFTSPRPIHPYKPRVITVREAARLHSYPDWFRFHVTKWHGFREIGNSVPPLLARAVAAQVRDALGVTPTKPAETLQLGDECLLSFDMRAASAFFDVPQDTIAKRTRSEDGKGSDARNEEGPGQEGASGQNRSTRELVEQGHRV